MMECDTEAETFSKDLFTYLWFIENLISKNTAVESVGDASDFVAEVSQAVIVLSAVAVPSFEKNVEEYFQESGISRRSVFTFLTMFCFNQHARNPNIFEVTLNTCTIIFRLLKYCHRKGHVEYIKFGSMCWTEIFKSDLRIDFYANGGWENFRKYITRHSYFPKTSRDKASFKLLNAMKDVFPTLRLAAPEEFASYFTAESVADSQLEEGNSSEDVTTSSPETSLSPEIIRSSDLKDSSICGTSDESADENNVLNNTIDETSDVDSAEEGNTGYLRTKEDTSDSQGDSEDDILMDIIRQELMDARNNAIATESSDVNNTEQVNPKCLGTNKESTDSSGDSDENMIEDIIRWGMKYVKINTVTEVSDMAMKKTVVSFHVPEDNLPIHNDDEDSDHDRLRVLQPMPQPSQGRVDEIDSPAESIEYDDGKDSDSDPSYVPQSIAKLTQRSEHPGAVGGSEQPGAVGGSEHPGAVGGSEHPGAVGGSEHPGAVGGSEHPGAVGGSEHPGAVGGSEHPGAVGGSEHLGDVEAVIDTGISHPKRKVKKIFPENPKESNPRTLKARSSRRVQWNEALPVCEPGTKKKNLKPIVPYYIPEKSLSDSECPHVYSDRSYNQRCDSQSKVQPFQGSSLSPQEVKIDPLALSVKAISYDYKTNSGDDHSRVSQTMDYLSQGSDIKPQKGEMDPPKLIAEAAEYDDEKDSDDDPSCVPQPMAQPSQGSDLKPQDDEMDPPALPAKAIEHDDEKDSDYDPSCVPQPMAWPSQCSNHKPRNAIVSSALLVQPQDSDDKIESNYEGPFLPHQMVQPFQSNDLKPEIEKINSFPSLPLEAEDLRVTVTSKKPLVIKADDSL